MKTKKYVLIFGIIGTAYIVILTLFSVTYLCPNNQTCTDLFIRFSPWSLANYIFFTPFLFLLSLITYKMRDEVFRAWWGFARWWVPVIIAVTLFVQNAGGGGGWGMNGGAFDAFFIGIFYFIFILVSLIKIVRAYLKTKEI